MTPPKLWIKIGNDGAVLDISTTDCTTVIDFIRKIKEENLPGFENVHYSQIQLHSPYPELPIPNHANLDELDVGIGTGTMPLKVSHTAVALPVLEAPKQSPFTRGAIAQEAKNVKRAILAKAFNIDYQDPQHMVDNFICFLDLAASLWDPRIYAAPYTSFVQSSMFGKSRLMKEVGKRRWTFYMCLRKQQSSGYPTRSFITSNLLVKEESQQRWAVYFRIAFLVAACYFELAEYLDTTEPSCDKWIDHQVNESEGSDTAGDAFWIKIQQRMKDIELEIVKNYEFKTTELLNYKDIDSFGETNVKAMDRLLKSAIKTVEEKLSNKEANATGALVWVFDEARELLYRPCVPTISDSLLFDALRIVLGRHPRECNIFAVMLDTQSKVSNFSPMSARDPSLRYLSNGSKLYDVWSSTGSFNNLTQHPKIDDILTSNENMLELHKKIFTLGRPYWGSYLTALAGGEVDRDTWQEAIRELTNVAEAKLLGGNINAKLDQAAAIAMLGFRVALWVAPQTELASKVVSSNMAFCLSISEDRRMVDTLFPSEPILAEAAGLYLNRCGWVECIDQLSGSIRCGAVGAGFRGELVCRILLQLAWDQSILSSCPIRKTTVTKVTSVGNFLRSMLDWSSLSRALENQVDDNVRDQFMNGMIFFTHFEPIDYMPKRLQLMNFFLRGAAIQCKDGHPAVDQIIPVLIKHGEAWKITFILIQDKCHSTYPSKVLETCDLITPISACLDPETDSDSNSNSDANLPYLLLYLEVGSAYQKPQIRSMKKFLPKPNAKKRKAEMETPADPPYGVHYTMYRMAVGVFGLCGKVYQFLAEKDKLLGSLKRLRTAKYDPIHNLDQRRSEDPNDISSVLANSHSLEALKVLRMGDAGNDD